MKCKCRAVVVLLSLVLVVFVVHCGKDDDGVIIRDNVVLPEQNAELQEVIVAGDTLKFVYTPGSTLPQFSAEAVVVGQEAGGYLKKVVTSVTGGDTVTLLTEPAVLTDAVGQAVVDTTFGLALQAGGLDGLRIDTSVTGRSGQVYGLKVTSGAPQLLSRGELFEVRYSNVVIQIYTGGNLAVSMALDTLVLSKNIDIDFDLEIRGGAIDRFRLVAGSTDGLSFRGVTIDAVYSISDDIEFLLAPLNLGTIVVWIGPLPVVFAFELNLYAGLEAALTVSAAAQFVNNVTLTSMSALGAEWSGGAWQAIQDWTLDGSGNFNLVQSATMDAVLKGYLRGSLGAKLYGVVGPELYLKGYQYTDLTYPPLDYELGVGLGAGLAFHVQVLSWELLDFNHTFAEYEKSVTGQMNAPPNTPSTPSGPSTGNIGTSYTFSSSATDPDGDNIAIRFAWGDGDTSSWSAYVPSGNAISMSHSWSAAGTYYIRAQAKDIVGATSNWSPSRSIVISAGQSFYQSDNFDSYPSSVWYAPPYVLLNGYGNWTSVEWNIMRGEAALDSNYIQVRDYPPGANNHATYHLDLNGNIVSLTVGFKYFMQMYSDIFVYISPNNYTWTEVTSLFSLQYEQPTATSTSANLSAFITGYAGDAYIRFRTQAYSGNYWMSMIDDFWVSGHTQ